MPRGQSGKFEFTVSYPRQGHAVRVEADGYMPAMSRTFKSDEKSPVQLEFKLKPAQMIVGTVKSPTGEPLPDAEVIVATSSGGAYIRNGEIQQRDGVSVKTDAAGKYKIPPQLGAYSIVVVHDKGYADVRGESIAKSPDVTLQPWARVTGVAKVGSKPAVGRTVSVNRHHGGGGRDEPRVYHHLDTPTDQNGKFTFERVPPGRASVALQVKLSENMTGYANSTNVEVEAGKTIEVQLGGTGRPVIGKINIPQQIAERVNWQYSHNGIRSNLKLPTPKQPDNAHEMDAAARQKWWQEWQKTPEGQAFQKAQENMKHYPLVIGADGSFRVDDVPAGPYVLNVNLMEAPVARTTGQHSQEQLANAQKEFVVPEIPGGVSDEPFDIGAVELKVVLKLKPGDAVPDFETKTLEGKPLKLSDYKGKFVLVDFWTPMYGPASPTYLAQMKGLFEAHGKDPRFVMINLSMDETAETTKKFVEKQGLGWTHAYIGTYDKTDLPRQWGMQNYPANYLIGPDGKLIAKSIQPEQLKAEIEKALKAP
jgi:peroxiredoxin